MKTIARGTDAALDRLARFDEPPGATTELRTPRRLPQLRAPRWLDRLAEHRLTARVSWAVCGVCLTASAVLVVLMLVTGPAPAAPHGSTPSLKPAPSDVPTPVRTTHAAPPVQPSARPSARPTGSGSPTGNPSAARTPAPRQAPAQPSAAPRASTTPKTGHPTTPATGGNDEPTPPTCTRGGITYQPGTPGYDDCIKPHVGPGEPGNGAPTGD